MSTGRRPSHEDLRELVARGTEELREARRALPPFDEEAFKQQATRMMETSEDQDLHNDVWDYREGKIDRFELRRRPAFASAWSVELDATLHGFEANGVAEFMRAFVAGVEADEAAAERHGVVERR